MSKALEIKNLNFSYENESVLRNASLTVLERDFLGIIGSNGSGKSTLVKIILGFLKPSCGEIFIFNKKYKSNQNLLGYVPQNINLNKNFPISVKDVVLMGRLKKSFFYRFKKDDFEIVKESLSKVKMEKFQNRTIGELSGGQRQRVLIARALASRPKILLLDEPTANIDNQGEEEILSILQELNQEITIIMISHNIKNLLKYANKIAHINQNIHLHDTPELNLKEFDDKHCCTIDLINLGLNNV